MKLTAFMSEIHYFVAMFGIANSYLVAVSAIANIWVTWRWNDQNLLEKFMFQMDTLKYRWIHIIIKMVKGRYDIWRRLASFLWIKKSFMSISFWTLASHIIIFKDGTTVNLRFNSSPSALVFLRTGNCIIARHGWTRVLV